MTSTILKATRGATDSASIYLDEAAGLARARRVSGALNDYEREQLRLAALWLVGERGAKSVTLDSGWVVSR